MLLPVGACDDGAHSQNEKIDRRNYIEGVSNKVPPHPPLDLEKWEGIFQLVKSRGLFNRLEKSGKITKY